jgi:integrase
VASIQARHTRACELEKAWAPFSVTDGCTCDPTYYTVVRHGTKLDRQRVGKNRRHAEVALRKVAVQVDEGAWAPVANIRFNEWGDRWLRSLEGKENTRRSYVSTIEYAKLAFGQKHVRHVSAADITRFNLLLREQVTRRARNGEPVQKLSASSRSKHLRVLGACFNSAISHGYAGRNPVKDLPKSEKPRPERKEAAYFTNDELPRLFMALPHGLPRVVCEVALKTGMRQGELVALTWADIDLTAAVIRVRHSYTAGFLSDPKNHERRDVDLTPDVVQLFGWWWGELGKPADDTLVFAGPCGYLTADIVLRRWLYPSMKRAAIDRVGPTGEKRTFHSFRHSFAKVALENGRQITWLSRHMGHSSLKVTTDIYGHFERAERKKQIEQMAGVFGV